MVAKLTDVAELAGVSPTTVSRVINKKGYLSQKTIDKVHAAMQELNYKPNNLSHPIRHASYFNPDDLWQNKTSRNSCWYQDCGSFLYFCIFTSAKRCAKY